MIEDKGVLVVVIREETRKDSFTFFRYQQVALIEPEPSFKILVGKHRFFLFGCENTILRGKSLTAYRCRDFQAVLRFSNNEAWRRWEEIRSPRINDFFPVPLINY